MTARIGQELNASFCTNIVMVKLQVSSQHQHLSCNFLCASVTPKTLEAKQKHPAYLANLSRWWLNSLQLEKKTKFKLGLPFVCYPKNGVFFSGSVLWFSIFQTLGMYQVTMPLQQVVLWRSFKKFIVISSPHHFPQQFLAASTNFWFLRILGFF